MNNIIVESVRETGCIMYKDEQGNYMDSFFISQYWFDQLTSKQVQTLTELLQKDNIKPFEIFYKESILYLTFQNYKGDSNVYEIYRDGWSKVFSQIDKLDIVDDDFVMLHDFLKSN